MSWHGYVAFSCSCHAKLVFLVFFFIAVSSKSCDLAKRNFMCRHHKHRNKFCIKDIFVCYKLQCLLTIFYEVLWCWYSTDYFCIYRVLYCLKLKSLKHNVWFAQTTWTYICLLQHVYLIPQKFCREMKENRLLWFMTGNVSLKFMLLWWKSPIKFQQEIISFLSSSTLYTLPLASFLLFVSYLHLLW
jgi:hypothetical protein